MSDILEILSGWRGEDVDRARTEITRLRAERDELVEALRFYADVGSYIPECEPGAAPGRPVILDAGDRARAVLAKVTP